MRPRCASAQYFQQNQRSTISIKSRSTDTVLVHDWSPATHSDILPPCPWNLVLSPLKRLVDFPETDFCGDNEGVSSHRSPQTRSQADRPVALTISRRPAGWPNHRAQQMAHRGTDDHLTDSLPGRLLRGLRLHRDLLQLPEDFIAVNGEGVSRKLVLPNSRRVARLPLDP